MKVTCRIGDFTFHPFCSIDDAPASQFLQCLCLLTKRIRVLHCGKYICLRRLGILCSKNDVSLSTFFEVVERRESCVEDDMGYIHVGLDTIYRAIDLIKHEKGISDCFICVQNNWDKGNYIREKSLALNGKRETISLMKLHGILSVLDVSFSSFFLFTEKLQLDLQ